MEIASLLSAQASPSVGAEKSIGAERMAQIERKAEEFEALVLAQMLAPMFETAKTPGLFGGDGPEQDVFSSLLHEEYAKSLAARGGVGIADQVKDALIRMQSNATLP